jgi:hypothetical protein
MMKKIIFSFVAIVSILGYSCRKEDNPILPELQGGIPVPKIVADANSELVIDVTKDPATFAGKFNVGLLYPNDIPQKVDIVVIKNGDKSTVKTVKADVTTLPATVEITGAELISLFGSPIELGDFFDIAADVTLTNGQKLLAFPANGVQYAAGIAAIPGSAPVLRYSAICKFDADEYAGDFVVVEDEWEDYPVGSTITLTKVDETHLSFLYGADNAKPIVLTITPTNAVVVEKQVYGTYSWGAQYGNFSVETIGNIDDAVKPCDQTLSVLLKHTVSAGSFGEYRITLRKKN